MQKNTRAPSFIQDDGKNDEIDVFALLATLWRGKWIIGLCATIFILIGGYNAFVVAVPKYTASTTLTLQLRNANVVDIDSVVSGVSTDDAALNTELEVIRSRILIKKLVDELELDKDPEFNTSLRAEPNLSVDQLIRHARTWVTTRINGTAQEPQVAPEQVDEDPVLNRVVTNVRRAISTTSQRNSYVFNIRATTEAPRKSALLANTLARLYIEDQIEVKFQATENAVLWLSDRVIELKTELEGKEDAIKMMRARIDLSSTEELEAINQQARDVRQRLDSTRSDAENLQLDVDRLQGLRDANDFKAMAADLNDVALDRLLTNLQQQDNARAVSLFLSRFDLLHEQIKSRQSRAAQQSDALESSLQRLETDMARLSDQLITLQQLERDMESTRTLYETFLTRQKETSVQRGIQQADSRILSGATPGTYVAPLKTRMLLLSALFGVFIGSVIVLLRQFLHFGFRTSDELETATGWATLGQLPKMPIRKRKQLVTYLTDNPTSASSEAIRNLRTSVLLSNVDSPPQVIMITSSVPGEGKTTQAISLAHNFSGLDKRVLLLECDIRRRTFNNYFNIPQKHGGLISLLDPDVPLEDVMLRDPRLSLDILVGEATQSNAADIFASQKFQHLMNRLRKEYDYIIIDTPPVLVVPDARVIGQMADLILFSVAWNKTKQGLVKGALQQFQTTGHAQLGCVLTQIDGRGMKRYGYDDRYGANGKGYYDIK